MKAYLAMLAAFCCIAVTHAEDALMEGGRSVDGQYEIRIARVLGEADQLLKREATDYSIGIYESGNPKPIHSLDRPGHLHYTAALEYCHALWHSSSRFVVISDRPARHFQTISVFDVSKSTVKRFELPDYIQNALGRIDATTVDFACSSAPKRWDGDDLVVELYFTAKGRMTYTCNVIFSLGGLTDSYATLGLKEVTQPQPKGG